MSELNDNIYIFKSASRQLTSKTSELCVCLMYFYRLYKRSEHFSRQKVLGKMKFSRGFMSIKTYVIGTQRTQTSTRCGSFKMNQAIDSETQH